MFSLDERLANDTITLASWPLCEVLLMNDSQYPWVILVPREEGLKEIYQLTSAQRKQLDQESVFLSEQLMTIFSGDKLNVAALGNVVSQLHIHHIVRFADDKAWPAPIWGKFPPVAYDQCALDELMRKLDPVISQRWPS